jgi:hypothetical protein
MTISDRQRLDRVEQTAERHAQAIAELVLWVRGNWQSNSAAGRILAEQRQREQQRAEREGAIRQEAQAKADAEVDRRLAESSA